MKKDQRFITLGSKDPKFNFNGGYSMMDNETLYRDGKSYFDKYVDTNKKETGLLFLYASATHVYENYQNFPILHFLGDYQTGKNRRLELLDPLCLNPSTYANATLASLFRTTDGKRGTIILDEADSLLGIVEIKNFLLAGYQKGVTIPRMVPDSTHPKGYRPEKFEIYGPKVIVSREGTDDEALNSRSIIIITLSKSADSIVPDTLPKEAVEEGKELKKRVEIMISNIGDINSEDVDLGLRGRDAQLFECLKDVAALYGNEAVNDLRIFVDQDYIPDSKYNTMLTIQQDLIRALDDCWINGNVAHLTTLASKLEVNSSDYRNVGSKRIARVLRSLGFKTDERDNRGQYVSPNSELMKLLKTKYQIEDKLSDAGVSSVDNTDIGRPKRKSTVDKFDSIRKMFLRRK